MLTPVPPSLSLTFEEYVEFESLALTEKAFQSKNS